MAPVAEDCPAAQAVHADAPDTEYVPAPQRSHAAGPEYLPAMQVLHTVAPAVEDLPGAQVAHAAEPTAALKNPALHCPQTSSSPPLVYPASHAHKDCVSSGFGTYPGIEHSHSAAPPMLVAPDGHGRHASPPT
jgi:hypothetical protein